MDRRRPTGAAIITDLIQLIYVSQPFGYDMPTLNGILMDARECNTRDDITGALVCRQDIYLQLLEGPADKVAATYARILRDDRHAGAQELVNRPASHRIFGDWAMLHDPARSWIWSEEDLSTGALERATKSEIIRLFEDLAARVAEGTST